MSDIYKFPSGGYEVTVFKKQDILDCIDNNILDKEIALTLIEQLEIDAANFLKEGRWTGIPFIGNIRVPKLRQLQESPEQQALIEEAKAINNNTEFSNIFNLIFHGTSDPTGNISGKHNFTESSAYFKNGIYYYPYTDYADGTNYEYGMGNDGGSPTVHSIDLTQLSQLVDIDSN